MPRGSLKLLIKTTLPSCPIGFVLADSLHLSSGKTSLERSPAYYVPNRDFSVKRNAEETEFACQLEETITSSNIKTDGVSHSKLTSMYDHTEPELDSCNLALEGASEAGMVQKLMKSFQTREELEFALDNSGLIITKELVLVVLHRHRSDWKPALFFFQWASNRGNYSHESGVYNVMIDILGRMKRFDEMWHLVKEMYSSKDGPSFVTERTFEILINRYAADHKVEKAIETFYKRENFGLKLDKVAFQILLLALCRYKHVQEAESLLYLKKEEFPLEIRSRNIILNGWCLMGNLREVKRLWNDIISSGCAPDLYTYGIFINALTKGGNLGSAVELFKSMWEKGLTPDVAICNSILDALCFKKKIPEALSIFNEMNERGCLPDVVTYNSLIKYMCKIRRMEKAYELLDVMEQNGCTPNARTYHFFLRSTKNKEEFSELLKRMKRTGCVFTSDTQNLILRILTGWDDFQGAYGVWREMERGGRGPDQRSYTVMVHRLYEKGRMDEAFGYYAEMISKGMIPEPRTKLLADAYELKQAGKYQIRDQSDTEKRPLL
ncbi:putative pentatricopeptide repeat-containing protein At3g15200 [Amborella trichopoda]|uniref:Pentacotripeptide-repeat region of PRORP domain-containing protein n=1 Tax=Amborella trichopoda TaxID=13333 RepID=W1PTY7_AMBTC|nr:putative pentatricopeptide repeat-containing protein At3g15200 [Amborella trichopoda]XP_020526532.1 putative pentatricopeptide repeat-containing protein At3g15200 [Amborella trichopoda]XP_020526533.1 putative pentatricopeptide repeat-containing protein At3g15200 [Amborella trichopoda]ERN11523.1 hypothetical protein AMTR_s00022p00129420 [Amborella trichopoda]|eukprot:XP_006849942.1 putative pentatricopeptide repeat-containing protein At3g15200 [Amborella trichopoda]